MVSVDISRRYRRLVARIRGCDGGISSACSHTCCWCGMQAGAGTANSWRQTLAHWDESRKCCWSGGESLSVLRTERTNEFRLLDHLAETVVPVTLGSDDSRCRSGSGASSAASWLLWKSGEPDDWSGRETTRSTSWSQVLRVFIPIAVRRALDGHMSMPEDLPDAEYSTAQ